MCPFALIDFQIVAKSRSQAIIGMTQCRIYQSSRSRIVCQRDVNLVPRLESPVLQLHMHVALTIDIVTVTGNGVSLRPV